MEKDKFLCLAPRKSAWLQKLARPVGHCAARSFLQVRVSEVARHGNNGASESDTSKVSFAKLRGPRKPEVASVHPFCTIDGAWQKKTQLQPADKDATASIIASS